MAAAEGDDLGRRVPGVGSLPTQVPVDDPDVETLGRAEPARELLGHRHAAVLAAGAADRDRHEALALARYPAAMRSSSSV